ncbi:MAG: phosphoribosylamine--glycine ligase, partial [Chitinophagaceae bacterium]|nr:phosphoribosylamine--glycine ligase [Chitinophagaceae bacterium]
TAKGELANSKIEIEEHHTVTVALVSGGYPGDYEKGKNISGLNAEEKALVFHAGTKKKNDTVLTDGGRVLAVSGTGKSLKEARDKAYKAAAQIDWDGLYFRKDIGKDLMDYKG